MYQKGPIDPSFQARLDRIRSGKAEMTNGAAMVGNALTSGPPMRRKRAVSAALLRDAALSPVGLVLGFASVVLSRVLVLNLFAPDGPFPLHLEDPVYLLGVDLGIAALMTLLIVAFLGFSKGFRRFGVLAGFLAAILAEPRLMDVAPTHLAAFYPDQSIRAALLDH